MNCVAVASLLGLACIIITENGVPDSDTRFALRKRKSLWLVTPRLLYWWRENYTLLALPEIKGTESRGAGKLMILA